MNDPADGPVPSEDDESFVCALCGHEMTFDRCGFAGVNEGDETLHLCHADDHDCYERFTVNGERPDAGPVCNLLSSGEFWVPRACVQPLGHSGFHADCFGQTWTPAAGPMSERVTCPVCGRGGRSLLKDGTLRQHNNPTVTNSAGFSVICDGSRMTLEQAKAWKPPVYDAGRGWR